MTTATDLTPTEVIDRVRAARKAQQKAAVEELELALRVGAVAPLPRQRDTGALGRGRPARRGPGATGRSGCSVGRGVRPVELAAALGITQDAGRQLIADALELDHRLPRLWNRVVAGEVPVWRARLIARETTDLSQQAALFADRLIAATPRRIGQVHAARLVQEARLYFDPDRALADEEEALTKRGVWLRHGHAPATTDITMTLDTPDALLFDQTVTRIAGDLKELGDTEDLEVRRARAVGILADPQFALDLLTGRDEAAPSRGARAAAANLYVHLTAADLDADRDESTGAAWIERLGAATTRLLTDWLTRFAAAGTKITLRPVLDLNSTDWAVDQHDPPAAMRETVVLRDATCVFPGCRRDSRACDLDHITEYLPMQDGGPPGQTHPANLAPLCRAHHRVKTHTTWRYKRLDDGSYDWTSPTGHQYRVTPASRRTALGLF